MKIAHFSYEYPPSTTGGLGTYLEALVHHQRDAGHGVQVFFLADEAPPPGTLSLPFYRRGELLSYGLEEIRQVSSEDSYDIVVCHDWAGALVSEPLWRRRVPLVMTCHLPLAYDIGYYDDLPCDYARELEFFAAAQANLVIAVSGSTRDFLARSYPFARHKIAVVHNGTDTAFFSPKPKDHGDVVAYVGRFAEQKGFDRVPDIFRAVKARVPAARLKVAGVGPLESQFHQRVADLGLSDSVEVHGFLSLQEVRALYHEADVVLMPSFEEPFGLVAIESMATATPVVASRTGGLAEIIEHGEDGWLVERTNLQGFADGIVGLLSDLPMRAEMGHKARCRAVARFDQRDRFAETTALYAQLSHSPLAWAAR